TIRDLLDEGRLACVTEHGRGAENLLSRQGQPAETSEDCIADSDGYLLFSDRDDLGHEERVPTSCAVKGDGIDAPALDEDFDGFERQRRHFDLYSGGTNVADSESQWM